MIHREMLVMYTMIVLYTSDKNINQKKNVSLLVTLFSEYKLSIKRFLGNTCGQDTSEVTRDFSRAKNE